MAHTVSFTLSWRIAALVAVAVLCIFIIHWSVLSGGRDKSGDIRLTTEERVWLDSNPDKLILYYNTDFPPVEFAAEDGSFAGLGADVVAQVEKRLDIDFIEMPCSDWNRHLQALEEGYCAVAPTIVRTDERERYAYFTVPYASVPVVLIATGSAGDNLTLHDLEGLSVAVVSGYATEEYVRRASGVNLDLITMWNVPRALQAVAFGEVDVLVENLAVAAYFADKEGLSNLRVAGVTEYYFEWSIGVSRKYPLLFSSIQKALADIPRSDLEDMSDNWISMQPQSGVAPAIMQKIQGTALFVALLLVSLFIITLYLKRRLNEKISTLEAAQVELLEKSKRLQHAEKMEALGNLAGGIAHDFNNILQVIEGYAQLLLSRGNVPEDERKSLDFIAGAGRRAATLIGQLMAFSRHVEFRKTPVDMNAEVANAAEMLRQTIPKMIEIRLDLKYDLPSVMADPVHIEQVVFNLAGNSVDAMPDGGELLISTMEVILEKTLCEETGVELNGSYVVLKVSDTGCGISSDVQENMFNPFYTTKEPGKGTGLGLASVYGIVKSLGGCIRCNSSEEQGTTFVILLPSAPASQPEAHRKNRRTKPPSGKDEAILVVDDEPVIASQSKEFLTEMGYRVNCAASGEEALELGKENKYDLILLDLNMPGMGGYRCLKEIKAIDPEQKVLIVSGHSEYEVNLSELMKEASGFLRKPYRLDALARRIRELLADEA